MGKQELPQLPPGVKVKGKYEVNEVLGAGAFGAVYRVKCLVTGKSYAMKTESANERVRILKLERLVLQDLQTKVNSPHTCRIVDKGRSDDRNWNFVVMTLVGPSLQNLKRTSPRGRFTLPTALRVSRQCLEGIWDLHKANYLHRDIKPANFAIGRKETQEHRTVFIIDFGLCRRFNNERGELRSQRESAGFRGTVRYAPLSTHLGVDMCRKDDIESWIYLLIEFTVGRLPWSTLQEKVEVLEKKKESRRDRSLFVGVPPMVRRLLAYTESLAYWDTPDYDYFLRMIDLALPEVYPEAYDWELSNWPLGP